ncbi:hypothetical protein F5B21DRAFT_486064 [Xylaria acuta]|nr:hypothetical protein F5B21DRAFT_486064 [Xylaria acuta]
MTEGKGTRPGAWVLVPVVAPWILAANWNRDRPAVHQVVPNAGLRRTHLSSQSRNEGAQLYRLHSLDIWGKEASVIVHLFGKAHGPPLNTTLLLWHVSAIFRVLSFTT